LIYARTKFCLSTPSYCHQAYNKIMSLTTCSYAFDGTVATDSPKYVLNTWSNRSLQEVLENVPSDDFFRSTCWGLWPAMGIYYRFCEKDVFKIYDIYWQRGSTTDLDLLSLQKLRIIESCWSWPRTRDGLSVTTTCSRSTNRWLLLSCVLCGSAVLVSFLEMLNFRQ